MFRHVTAALLGTALSLAFVASVAASPITPSCTVSGDGFVHVIDLKPGKTYSVVEYTATSIGRFPAFVADSTGTRDEMNVVGDALTLAEVRNASDHTVASCTL